MSNWCITDYSFNGQKEEVESFHARLEEILTKSPVMENDFGSSWLGNIVADYGFDWSAGNCRGSVEYIGPIEDNDDIYSFILTTETAWEPMPKMWDEILKKEYPSITYVLFAIEEGTDLYVNTDIQGKYFPNRYLLNILLPEKVLGKKFDEYDQYPHKETLLLDLFRITGKRFNDTDEAEDYLRNLAKERCPNDEYRIVIREFQSKLKCSPTLIEQLNGLEAEK